MSERKNMKQNNKTMNRYTNFILTVIAVALIGILFKGDIVSPAKANLNQFDRNMLDNILSGLAEHHEKIRARIIRHGH